MIKKRNQARWKRERAARDKERRDELVNLAEDELVEEMLLRGLDPPAAGRSRKRQCVDAIVNGIPASVFLFPFLRMHLPLFFYPASFPLFPFLLMQPPLYFYSPPPPPPTLRPIHTLH